MNSHKINALDDIRAILRRYERVAEAGCGSVSLGDPAIDGSLPWNGLPRAFLHEFEHRPGDGAATGFIAGLLSRLMGTDGAALWCHVSDDIKDGVPYGPSLARFGVSTERLIFVRAREKTELLWAMEECLRSHRFAAVIGEGAVPDLTATRRLQLAAETGATTALLSLPHRAGRISAAATRWRVTSLPSDQPDFPQWHVMLERCRGGGTGIWHTEWDHEALRLRVLAALADRPVATAE